MIQEAYTFLRKVPELRKFSDEELLGEVYFSFKKDGLIIAEECGEVVGVLTGISYPDRKVYYNFNAATNRTRSAITQLVDLANKKFPGWTMEYQRGNKQKSSNIKIFSRMVKLKK